MKHCRLIPLFGRLLPAKTGVLAAWLERHRATCPACRRGHENELALEAALRAHAVEHRVPTPPFLAGRIKVAVRAEGDRRAQPRRTWHLVMVGAATAAVALALILWPGRSSTGSSDAAAVEFTRQQADALVRQVEAWSPDKAWTLAGGMDGSLQSELDAILSDARSAALLVVRACVPEESRIRLLPGQ